MRWRFVAIAVISIAVFGAQTAHASVIQMTPNNIGLVGYWSFNEGTSTNARDYAGSGKAGTLSGSTLPQWVAGKFGTALNFDGSSSYVDMTGSSGVADNLSNFSVSAWFKTTAAPGGWGGVLVSKVGSGGIAGGTGWVLGIGGPSLVPYSGPTGSTFFETHGGAAAVYSTAALNDGNWHNIVGVISGSGTTISLYIDGSTSGTGLHSDASSNYSNSSNVRIGTDYDGEFFSGTIDDVRVYDRALSATEVAGLYQSGLAKINVSQSPGTLSQGLVGWWTMDGADTVWSSPTAGTETDKSGNGNTGTLNGMTRSGSPTVGKIGQALNFDGSSSYVDMTGSSGVADNLSNFTVSAWFKTSTSVSGQAEIVSKFSTGGLTSGQGWALDDDGNSLIGIIQQEPPGNYAVKGSTASVDDGNWHQGVMVVTGGNTVTLYLDGQAQSPAANNGTVTTFTNASDIRIGNDYNSDFFPGSIDDVRVYDRALSASEIQQLYALGAGTHINTSSANLQSGSSLSQGLVGLWTFDGPTISGTTVDDLSGQGNNGTNHGAVPTIGKLGQALSFNGSSQYVSVPRSSSLEPTSVTITAWVKAAGHLGQAQAVLLKTYQNDSTPPWVSYGLGYDRNGDYKFEMDVGNTSDAIYDTQSNGALTPNEWEFIAGTYDEPSGTVSLYLNGKYDSGGTFTGPLLYDTTSSGGLYISSDGGATPPYVDGDIDDVRVYDRALSASEVQHLYLMGQ